MFSIGMIVLTAVVFLVLGFLVGNLHLMEPVTFWLSGKLGIKCLFFKVTMMKSKPGYYNSDAKNRGFSNKQILEALEVANKHIYARATSAGAKFMKDN